MLLIYAKVFDKKKKNPLLSTVNISEHRNRFTILVYRLFVFVVLTREMKLFPD